MAHGKLTPAQQEAIKPFLKGLTVHDLGAGDLELAQQLLTLGASEVVAIDRHQMPKDHPEGVRTVVEYFHNFRESVNTAFVSWPINWQDIGLLRLIDKAATVIYLGTNYDGSACGFPQMWEHLSKREILVTVPDPKNTLIVYGPRNVRRELVGEEFAALHQERIYSFEELRAWGDGVDW
jgi:hypothetical protein